MKDTLVAAKNRSGPAWRRKAGFETGENNSITALSGKMFIKLNRIGSCKKNSSVQ
jgi:hypothetical protein